jgi:hypothetical protein
MAKDPRRARRTQAAMAEEQSHREEMNAAIRAQRERQKAVNPTPPPPPAPERAKSPLARLVARMRGK